MFSLLTYQLFSQIAVGGLVAMLPVSKAAGKSFFRFCGLSCVACLALALGVMMPDPGPATGWMVFAGLAAVAFVASVALEKEPLQKPVLCVASVAGLVAVSVDGWYRSPADLPPWAAYLTTTYFTVSAIFLGSVLYAMILGHWYLVVPTLAIGPLRRLTLMMILATVAKTVLVGATLYALHAAGGVAREAVDQLGSIRGIFFWARVLFGLIGPLAICYMTWETVKINSTQSATGLLYVATIFALIGETLSRFVFYTTHLPV